MRRGIRPRPPGKHRWLTAGYYAALTTAAIVVAIVIFAAESSG